MVVACDGVVLRGLASAGLVERAASLELFELGCEPVRDLGATYRAACDGAANPIVARVSLPLSLVRLPDHVDDLHVSDDPDLDRAHVEVAAVLERRLGP